nr:immunoglobulin heavy chain junction region [Macaca mulatta]MOX37949.1 immunoglobulin heavy chain junction region [Macaca mulatta]MOX37980.1 immunoglobulin heavy chain junction region [Macaca mulatta]MOX37991.1 immunoglobulin heavy chain junction region [Macaca mulatta]MOX38022.1 immunoglobulin heavy chain junction region [Macaca mulatta]
CAGMAPPHYGSFFYAPFDYW